jgi:hypothetical protein
MESGVFDLTSKLGRAAFFLALSRKLILEKLGFGTLGITF